MMGLHKKFVSLSGLALSALFVSSAVAAKTNIAGSETHHPKRNYSVAEALQNGETHLQFRLRDEYAHDDFFEQGNAVTLKALLGYETGSLNGMSAGLELNSVSAFSHHRFNDGAGMDATDPSPIWDPKGSSLTNGYLHYTGFPDTHLVIGRQYIRLDNERFFGSNDFRQTPQTFDAITLRNESFPVQLFYGYVHQFNGIRQTASEENDWAMNPSDKNRLNGHLINAGWHCPGIGKVVGYAYLVDDKDMNYLSSNTYGVRLEGDIPLNEVKLTYGLEYARQQDAHDNPADYKADFAAAELKFNVKPYYTRFAYEVLSGSDTPLSGYSSYKAFRTPYGSNHNFLGNADAFVATPSNGVKDAIIQAGAMIAKNDFSVTYHNFEAEANSEHFGYEWDFTVQRQFGEHYYAGLSYADFNAHSDGMHDTNKWWLTVGADFL